MLVVISVMEGIPLCQFKMQEVLSQPPEAIQAYLDCSVQETT